MNRLQRGLMMVAVGLALTSAGVARATDCQDTDVDCCVSEGISSGGTWEVALRSVSYDDVNDETCYAYKFFGNPEADHVLVHWSSEAMRKSTNPNSIACAPGTGCPKLGLGRNLGARQGTQFNPDQVNREFTLCTYGETQRGKGDVVLTKGNRTEYCVIDTPAVISFEAPPPGPLQTVLFKRIFFWNGCEIEQEIQNDDVVGVTILNPDVCEVKDSLLLSDVTVSLPTAAENMQACGNADGCPLGNLTAFGNNPNVQPSITVGDDSCLVYGFPLGELTLICKK